MKTCGGTMSIEYFTLTLFTFFNAIRIFGYAPQILRSLNDKSGAASTSMMTWLTFCCANTSSAAYAFVNNHDRLGVVMFGVNALCCAIIGGVTFWKRLLSITTEARTTASTSNCPFHNPVCATARRPTPSLAMPISVAAARAARQPMRDSATHIHS